MRADAVNSTQRRQPRWWKRGQQWLVRFPRAVPAAIFLLVCAITVLSVFAIESGETRKEAAQLREQTRVIGAAIERRGNANAAYLRAGAALFATREDVSRELFREFVNELQLDTDYRGADGIGWARALAPLEIAAFEEAMSSDMPGSFAVYPRPTGPTRRVVPVTFLHPDSERNRRASGFDMYSEPVRRAAMDEAARSVRPTASGKVVLVQEGDGTAPGFLIYMPVFEGAGAARQLRGFVYSPFNAYDFLSSALELTSGVGQVVRLYDGEASDDRLMVAIEAEEETGRSMRQPVTIANRRMTLEVEAVARDTLSNLSLVTLIVGLVVAMLLMLLVRLLTQRVQEDRAALERLLEQNSIRDSLTRELNHRVKNSLANVLSMISLTRRRTDDVDDFAHSLAGRVRALSATHDLLTQSEWGTTPLRAILEAELAPYDRQGSHSVELAGPPVELAPNDALSLGLAIHELATNAAKFGALATGEGLVSVTWEMIDPHLVRVVWQESGGPEVSAERKRGFGTDLIEKVVAHEFNRPVELDFAPTGVRCVLAVPVRRPSAFAIRERYRQDEPA